MAEPFISVIIPLYNKEETIRDTVISVLDQDYGDFELLIIDDGSTDNSFSVVATLLDRRIKVFQKTNGGVSDARNYGIKKASGSYIFLLDADDVISPHCFSTFSRLVNKYDEWVFTSNLQISKADQATFTLCRGKREKVLKRPFIALFNRKIYPRTGCLFINRKCFAEIGYFDTKLTIYEDLEFTLRLLKQYSIVYTPMVLLTYQTTFNELSINPIPISKEFAFHATYKERGWSERLIISYTIYHTAKYRLKKGEWRIAIGLFRKNAVHLPYICYSVVHRKIVNIYYKIFHKPYMEVSVHDFDNEEQLHNK